MISRIPYVGSAESLRSTEEGRASERTGSTGSPSKEPDGVVVGLSEDAKAMLRGAVEGDKQSGKPGNTEDSRPKAPHEMDAEERAEIARLRQREKQIRARHQANVVASGGRAKPPVVTYTTGPDGLRYASGGHVPIDTSQGSSPEETLHEARKLRAAAMAPADPSGRDRAVMAAAAELEMQALNEIARDRNEILQQAATPVQEDERGPVARGYKDHGQEAQEGEQKPGALMDLEA